MNTDKTMVAKGFGGKNFPILNKGNQVARCEGEIGVPNRGPRAMKGKDPGGEVNRERERNPSPLQPSELEDGQTGSDSHLVVKILRRSARIKGVVITAMDKQELKA
ncbi:hypothetical protein TNCV_3300301 [Trichonephila clavipes]|nr:hypothetical protein TNCV_3300301 [Trichonephila clavipes]